MNAQLKEAIDKIKAGDKRAGREILIELLRSDPDNEAAWLMATALNTPEKKQRALQRVLEINPDNETAKRQLSALTKVGSIDPTLLERTSPPVAIWNKPAFWISAVSVVVCICCALSFVPLGSLSQTTPRPTPSSTPIRGPYSDIETLVREIGGEKVGTLYYEPESPGNVSGYHVEIVVTSPNSRSREEMLQMTYDLMYHFHYNYTGPNSSYLSLYLGNRTYANCIFGAGIGHLATPEYLPEETPDDLESWFRALVVAGYYGDLPDQTDALQAFGGDPRDVPSCDIGRWKR